MINNHPILYKLQYSHMHVIHTCMDFKEKSVHPKINPYSEINPYGYGLLHPKFRE